VETFAIYRCLGSPVTVTLKAFDASLRVDQITKADGKFLLNTDRADLPVACVLK